MTLEKLAKDLFQFLGEEYKQIVHRLYQKNDKIFIDLYTLTGTIKLTLEKGDD